MATGFLITPTIGQGSSSVAATSVPVMTRTGTFGARLPVRMRLSNSRPLM